MEKPSLRTIPAVEKVLRALRLVQLPRPIITAVVRRELKALRHGQAVPDFDVIVSGIDRTLAQLSRSRLGSVINGTGILIHTNLGRAPLGARAIEALEEVAGSYSNLEVDLESGDRGGRAPYLEGCLALLCQAEAATVVNNGAAALLLGLRHFTRTRPEVIISRGELVQIGGGFRIPEILEASGARLREVGTTNQTSLADYAQAVGPQTGLILKVHRSNFFMDGFVDSPGTGDLAELARRKRLPFMEDLGSGAMLKTETLGLAEHEPTPADVLAHQVDLVTFSGDKLLGGPQAGIIAGRAKWVKAIKREPFFRALRCDKLVMAALQATVDAYLAGTAAEEIPILRMLVTSEKELHKRAGKILAGLSETPLQAIIGRGTAQPGGGTLPRSKVPSVTLNLRPASGSLAPLAHALRTGTPPVIGYLSGGWLKIDLRTVLPGQDGLLLGQLLVAAFALGNRSAPATG